MKYVIKLYFIYFLIFFCRDLSFAWGNQDIVLRWPSVNIISSILKINDLFGDDFYTNSILNTPLRTIINVFSIVLPENHLELISAYSIFSLIFKSLLPITLIFLSSTITTLIIREFNSNNNFNIKNHFSNSFFIGNIIFLLSKQSEFLKDIFFGTPIALWGFPTALSSSRGISLFISLIAVNITLLTRLFRPNDYKLNNKLLILLFIINLSASIIHPISPLFSLVIVFLLNLLINKNILSWLNLFIIFFTSWVLGVLVILILYPQGNIENLDLFRIYIEGFHQHHYLPTYYINQILKWKFLLCNFLISIIIIFLKRNNLSQGIFIKLLISNISILTFINLNQYLLVEIFKKSLFIKFGLTFLNITFNFFYFLSILLFLSLQKFRFKRIIKNIFKLKFIQKNKSLRIIDLTLITLAISALIFSSSIYQSNITKVKGSITYITGNKIKSINTDTAEFIVDPKFAKDFKYPREIGLINIFHDSYFPFYMDSLKLWEKRNIDIKELENCLKSDKNKCYLPNRYEKEIFYISKIKQLKLGKEIFKENINNTPIFINIIEKK